MSSPAERRVLVVSYRRCLQNVAFTGIFDFEDLICDWESADLIELPAHRGSLSFEGPRSAYQGLRTIGVPAERALKLTKYGRRLIPPQAEYDVAIFVTGSIFDLFGISWLVDSLPSFNTSIAYTLEAWPGQLQPRPVDLEPFDVFDRIYVGLLDGSDALAGRHGSKIGFLPPAANVARYNPLDSRPTMAVNFGRYNAEQHTALLRAQEIHGRPYQHDTISSVTAKSISQHRQNYANLLCDADLMISNYAKFDQPQIIGSHHEVPMRLFEALAAGCLPIGLPPSDRALAACDLSDCHRAYFPLHSDPSIISDILSRPDELRAKQLHNRTIALERHDWGHRWMSILADAGLAPTAILRNRLDAMAEESKRTLA